MDVLNVVQQLRDLASDPQNRAAIVRVRCNILNFNLAAICILQQTWQHVHGLYSVLSCGSLKCATCDMLIQLLQDPGCLPGLVIFLDNEDPQVVLTALEVSPCSLYLLFYLFLLCDTCWNTGTYR